MSQNDDILAILRERGEAGFTPNEAYTQIGCLRLAARIDDLRHGYLRDGEEIVNVGGTSNGKHFAKYVLRRIDAQMELFG